MSVQNTDEQIIAEVEAPTNEGESMDVLLQVTLPIVLILAFLVVTEVQSLTEQIQRLKSEIEGTATGRLTAERDTALIDLQRQLLHLATREVTEEKEEWLALGEYRLRAPEVADLVAGHIEAQFTATSAKLFEMVGEPGRRESSERQFREEVEERFRQLVEERTSLDSYSRSTLGEISAENRASFQTEIKGVLERFVEAGSDVQLGLMLSWLEDPDISVRKESVSLWRAIQGRLFSAERDYPVQARFDEFVNLKARQFVETMERLGAPVLEQTKQQAKL